MPVPAWMTEAKEALLHMIYPHHCLGCETDALHKQSYLCSRCVQELPATHFHRQPANLLHYQLGARLPLNQATAIWYFGKRGPLHQLVEALKYQQQPGAGVFLGTLMAVHLKQYSWFAEIDVLIPLPLNEKKQLWRGYNQAERIAYGIATQTGKEVIENAVVRDRFTDTQTHKSRSSRWQNMQEVFRVSRPDLLQGKHVLLIDDVVTTGATLESCGRQLLSVPGLTLSVATAGITSHQ